MTRRQLGGVAGEASPLPFALFDACEPFGVAVASNDGRLQRRSPLSRVTTTADGTKPLGLERGRDAILQVPAKSTGPLPLLVLLHGAGGSGERMLQRLGSTPETAGVAGALARFARQHLGCDSRRLRRGRAVSQSRAGARISDRGRRSGASDGGRLLGRRDVRALPRPHQRRPVQAHRGVFARLRRGRPAARHAPRVVCTAPKTPSCQSINAAA